ncbi:hypothetical protein CP532_5118 [Ophiocordyceps camponoti-leonardi (nom. inval.)]|nr:hypothetical protein CP532_5118 [Ophiocordyceps camponoti-leonardi (nom. inval.)]
MSSPRPNFDPAYVAADRGPGLRTFYLVMTIITVLSISMRFLSRAIAIPSQPGARRRFWLDDWLALAATPWVLAQLGLYFVAVHDGFGRHLATLPEPTLLRIAKTEFIVYFLYDAGLFFTKASALEFLRRVFPSQVSPRWFNICLWTGHAGNLAWLAGVFLAKAAILFHQNTETIFLCNPVAKDECLASGILWAIERPLHWGFYPRYLHRPIHLNTAPAETHRVTNRHAGVPVVYWVTAEPTISILVICLPAMLPLGRFLVDGYFSPLFSLVSLALNPSSSHGSRGRRRDRVGSRSGDFTTSTAEIHYKEAGHPNTPRQDSTATQG